MVRAGQSQWLPERPYSKPVECDTGFMARWRRDKPGERNATAGGGKADGHAERSDERATQDAGGRIVRARGDVLLDRVGRERYAGTIGVSALR